MANKLTVNPDNPRTISKEAFEQLKAKIQRNPDGLTANKIVHKDGIIIAGNQRWRAINELKLELQDDWFKDVSGWTPEQIREYLVTSNISDGDWNWDTLLNEYEPIELNDWGLEVPDWNDDKEVEEDEAPEVSQEPPKSELGKVYQLGRHRVMCGDSTVKENVELLMNGEKADMVFTDPPYGIKRDKGFGGAGGFAGSGKAIARTKYEGEWDSDIPPKECFDLMLGLSKKAIIFGGNFFAHLLPQGKHWIVWDKKNTMPTFGDAELAWTNIDRDSVKIKEFEYNGLIGREKEQRQHATQKPLGLIAEIITDYTKESEVITDLFLGSGTTLIACEQTDRICYGMELDPKYVDVIRKRYAKFCYPDTWEERWEELTPELSDK